MKKVIIGIVHILVTYFAIGQEFNLPIQNQYIADNPYLISSAYAGIGDCWQARVGGFEQWVGVNEAPTTQYLAIDGRISDRSGIGAIVYNDKNGFTSQRGFQASFAHHLTISDWSSHYLSFGLSYKFTQFGIDSSEFNRADPNNRGDININNSNFDVGLLYRLGQFFISLNGVNLLTKEIVEFNLDEPSTIQNYYGYAGYTITSIFKGIEFEPSVLYQNFVSDTRSSMDVNLKVRKRRKEDYFWAGISVRGIIDQDFKPLSVSPMFGLKKKTFYIAYGYQINSNEVLPASTGSHQLTLGIDFGCKPSSCGCTY